MVILITILISMCASLTSCGNDEPKNSKDVAKMLLGSWQYQYHDGVDVVETIKFSGTRFDLKVEIKDYNMSETLSGNYQVIKNEDSDYALVMTYDRHSEIVTWYIEEITSKKLSLYTEDGESATWLKK